MLENCGTEAARASCDDEGFVFEGVCNGLHSDVGSFLSGFLLSFLISCSRRFLFYYFSGFVQPFVHFFSELHNNHLRPTFFAVLLPLLVLFVFFISCTAVYSFADSLMIADLCLLPPNNSSMVLDFALGVASIIFASLKLIHNIAIDFFNKFFRQFF